MRVCVSLVHASKSIHRRRDNKLPRGQDDLANRCQLVPVLDIIAWCNGLRVEMVERCRLHVQ